MDRSEWGVDVTPRLDGRVEIGPCRAGRANTKAVSEQQRGPWFWTCAWASFLLPLAFALGRVDGSERWDQDTGVVRALELVQTGGEGVLSASLGAALSLLPLGTNLMRLSLLGALAVAAAGSVTFWAAYRLLAGAAARSLLALCAALVAALATSWQSSALSVGGPAVGAVVALGFAVNLSRRGWEQQTRSWVGYGAVLGLLLLESRFVGICSLVALGAHLACRFELPAPRDLLAGAATLAAVWVLGLLPSLLESGATGLIFGLDIPLPNGGAEPLSAFDELGVYLLCLALIGAWTAAQIPKQRELVVPLLTWVAVGISARNGAAHLVATSALGALSSVGLMAGLSLIRRARVPLSRPLVQVLGLFHLCALLLLVEGAQQQAEQRTLSATRQWSSQAFERLPARSMLLVSSPEASLRLWSARVTSGIRPDVVLVPSSMLSQGSWARQLLALEPKLASLIRDVATQGSPGEFALSELADARPLRVEVDQGWDRRLLRHLTGDGLWFRFAPHATGRTDRVHAQAGVRKAMRRVFNAAQTSRGRDTRTLERLQHDMFRQAAVSVVLGDRDNAERMLISLTRIGTSGLQLDALRQALRGNGDDPRQLLHVASK